MIASKIVAVAVAVEVLGVEADVEQHRLDRRLRDHHRPEDRLLGLEVLGGTTAAVPLLRQLLLSRACARLRAWNGHVPQVWIRARRRILGPRSRGPSAADGHQKITTGPGTRPPLWVFAECGAEKLPRLAERARWRCRRELLGVGDDRLHGGGLAPADLDLDHVGAGLADRLVEADLLALDLELASRLDRLGDLLGGDGAEQLAVLAGLVVDRQDGLAEQGGGLAGALGGLALLGLLALEAATASSSAPLVAGWASLRGIR